MSCSWDDIDCWMPQNQNTKDHIDDTSEREEWFSDKDQWDDLRKEAYDNQPFRGREVKDC